MRLNRSIMAALLSSLEISKLRSCAVMFHPNVWSLREFLIDSKMFMRYFSLLICQILKTQSTCFSRNKFGIPAAFRSLDIRTFTCTGYEMRTFTCTDHEMYFNK